MKGGGWILSPTHYKNGKKTGPIELPRSKLEVIVLCLVALFKERTLIYFSKHW